jgi:diacylglycerol kinase (ATP)
VKHTGLKRIFSAIGYSIDGLLVLIKEPALRQELILSLLVLISFTLVGASAIHFVTMSILLLMVIAVEALNTAIENIVDRISPEISDFAKRTKDLGSSAVFLLICGIVIYWIYVLGSTLSVF